MNYSIISNSVSETISIGTALGSVINSTIIIGVDGDMGCGKTHLIKGIGNGLGIDNNITSPTFNLINEYPNKDLDLYHFDVYRIDSIDELFLIGFDDYIKSNGVILIEWSSKIKGILPENTNYINLRRLSDTEREIKFIFRKDYEHILMEFKRKINEEILK